MNAPSELRFTFLACADLKGIWDGVAMSNDPWGLTASDNLAAGEAFASDFVKHCKVLGANPEVGVDRGELQFGMRSSIFRNYVIFYRLRGSSVEVIRVLRSTHDVGSAPW